jgi:hypothetical protein
MFERVINDLNVLAKTYEQVKMDEPTAAITYIGLSESKSLSSEPKWIIIKVEKVGTETTFLYATSFMNPNNIWDNRNSLTYSS